MLSGFYADWGWSQRQFSQIPRETGWVQGKGSLRCLKIGDSSVDSACSWECWELWVTSRKGSPGYCQVWWRQHLEQALCTHPLWALLKANFQLPPTLVRCPTLSKSSLNGFERTNSGLIKKKRLLSHYKGLCHMFWMLRKRNHTLSFNPKLLRCKQLLTR